MVISASYRTDVPAFYGEWFMNRLDAGYCLAMNPYSSRATRIRLDRNSVVGFVFWTKNLARFAGYLPEIRRRGYPFVVTYTITAYPRALERSVVDADRSAEVFRRVADRFGPRACVWRYDPVVFSSLTPEQFHLRQFERLAKKLSGATDEVIVSCAQIYDKTRRNMDRAARTFGFSWRDPADEEKRTLVRQFIGIAGAYGMKLSVCGQRHLLVDGAHDARCIDPERLADVGADVSRVRQKPHREECGCFESRDIGAYDTCPHGCVYCYAVSSRRSALARFKAHDPKAEFLVPAPGRALERMHTGDRQLPLVE